MQLKIWHKMIIGISIPSLIAILGSVFTYSYITDAENRQNYVEIADDLVDNVLELRRNEKNFLHYKNAEYLSYVTDALSVLDQSVSNISSKTVKEIGKKDLLSLVNLVDRYPELIQSLYENYQKENVIVENVRTEGRKLESYIKKGKNENELSLSFILHLRLLEKNYMLFRDRESYLSLNSGLSKLKNLTPLCYECDPYINGVHRLFEINQEIESISRQLTHSGQQLEKIAVKIADDQRRRISSFFRKTKHLLLAAMLMFCILAPFFVYKTTSYVVAPIKRFAGIAERIAEGDMSLRAPLKEHDETYSLAVSFNTMLDKLQLTHQSLERSIELLNEKQAQLVDSEKRASLGLLVSGVAHELNNPLNNISLTAEAINEDIENITKEELKEYIEDILKQRERVQHIVENLLDFARARRSTTMGKQNINLIVKESFSLITNQLRINNIRLVQDIPDTPFFIKGNRSKLEQILVSIYTNAIQAMQSGGTLSVRVRPDADENNIIIQISDTGKGIPESDVKSIFEPFFTTKAPGEGTGLGLSVCKSLAIEHNGEIEVESKVDEGTIFRLKFPMYEMPKVQHESDII